MAVRDTSTVKMIRKAKSMSSKTSWFLGLPSMNSKVLSPIVMALMIIHATMKGSMKDKNFASLVFVTLMLVTDSCGRYRFTLDAVDDWRESSDLSSKELSQLCCGRRSGKETLFRRSGSGLSSSRASSRNLLNSLLSKPFNALLGIRKEVRLRRMPGLFAGLL